MLSSCSGGRLALVHAEIRDPSQPVAATVRAALSRLVARAPASQVLRLMEANLGRVPRLVSDLLHRVLMRLQRQARRRVPRLLEIARELNTTPRSLERTCARHVLFSPKELLDWATLLFVTHAGEATGLGAPAAAMAAGLDSQQLHRLRRRLLGRSPPGTTQNGRTGFTTALLAFAMRHRDQRVPAVPVGRYIVA